ncbi:putative Cytochrome c domain-containing protein [Gammaproteobacteria bacterium]
MNNFTVALLGVGGLVAAVLIASWITSPPNVGIHPVQDPFRTLGPLERTHPDVPPVVEAAPETPQPPVAVVPTPSVPLVDIAQVSNVTPPVVVIPPPVVTVETTPPVFDPQKAREAYVAHCFACHETGASGSPVRGDVGAWGGRIARGVEVLTSHVLEGFNTMPARGGNPNLSDSETSLALAYLLSR